MGHYRRRIVFLCLSLSCSAMPVLCCFKSMLECGSALKMFILKVASRGSLFHCGSVTLSTYLLGFTSFPSWYHKLGYEKANLFIKNLSFSIVLLEQTQAVGDWYFAGQESVLACKVPPPQLFLLLAVWFVSQKIKSCFWISANLCLNLNSDSIAGVTYAFITGICGDQVHLPLVHIQQRLWKGVVSLE